LITIMMPEMKASHGGPGGVGSLLPLSLSYVLSFFYAGIYWNKGELPPALYIMGIIAPLCSSWIAQGVL
jgi:hypothetical protein